jgi:1-acyl-sn-glycerol-3-phosphate acyltransferase
LAALWLSQTARVTADVCLTVLVADRSAWPLVVALALLPAVVLAPVAGAVSNSLPRRWVLVGSAAYCLAVVGLFAWLNDYWLSCWALAALGSAVYYPTRSALLPAAADETHIPLTRINGWFALGAGAAVVAGVLITQNRADLAVGTVVALNLLGLLAAWPVWFAGDVCRRDPAGRALAGFVRDAARTFKDRPTRLPLLALAGFRGLFAATAVALVPAQDFPTLGLWLIAGLALGSLLAGVQGHPWRSHGLVPLGASGLAIGLVVAALTSPPSGGLCLALGIMAGLVNVPLAAAYQAALPAAARGNGMAVARLASAVGMAALAAPLYGLAGAELVPAAGQIWLVAVLALAGAWLAWWAFFQGFMEFLVEAAAWPFYRIRARGPGVASFPRMGPVVVISNHCCWFDPVFIAKTLPRRLTAMMTSQFYDRPLLHWFARHVVHAIRVQASTFRREAPELAEAVAALDAGEPLLIFPEGAMRRREQVPLKRFGQGIWHILAERPKTPVVVCWIEGNWGTYTSYRDGPPTVNKRMDFWRRIKVAVARPQLIDEAVLADHRETRNFLMRACLEARRLLGLEPLTLGQGADEEEAGDDGPKPAAPAEKAATKEG